MGSVAERHAGVASAVNNAVARAASLIAVALVPVLAGLSGQSYLDPQVFSAGYRSAMLISAGLTAVAGGIGWVGLGEPMGRRDASRVAKASGASRAGGRRHEAQP